MQTSCGNGPPATWWASARSRGLSCAQCHRSWSSHHSPLVACSNKTRQLPYSHQHRSHWHSFEPNFAQAGLHFSSKISLPVLIQIANFVCQNLFSSRSGRPKEPNMRRLYRYPSASYHLWWEGSCLLRLRLSCLEHCQLSLRYSCYCWTCSNHCWARTRHLEGKPLRTWYLPRDFRHCR